MIEFEWDENKNKTNIKKHGISFERAKSIFDNPTVDSIDTRKEYGEIREKSIGLMDNVVVVVVVHTDRKSKIRIISARIANKEEKQNYEKATKR